MNINQTLTVRARAGMALGRTLIYATGGYAGVGTNATFTTRSPAGGAHKTSG